MHAAFRHEGAQGRLRITPSLPKSTPDNPAWGAVIGRRKTCCVGASFLYGLWLFELINVDEQRTKCLDHEEFVVIGWNGSRGNALHRHL